MIQIDVLHGVKLQRMQKKIHTGIQSIEMFNVIVTLIKPYLPNLVYWTPQAKHRATSAK